MYSITCCLLLEETHLDIKSEKHSLMFCLSIYSCAAHLSMMSLTPSLPCDTQASFPC